MELDDGYRIRCMQIDSPSRSFIVDADFEVTDRFVRRKRSGRSNGVWELKKMKITRVKMNKDIPTSCEWLPLPTYVTVVLSRETKRNFVSFVLNCCSMSVWLSSRMGGKSGVIDIISLCDELWMRVNLPRKVFYTWSCHVGRVVNAEVTWCSPVCLLADTTTHRRYLYLLFRISPHEIWAPPEINVWYSAIPSVFSDQRFHISWFEGVWHMSHHRW